MYFRFAFSSRLSFDPAIFALNPQPIPPGRFVELNPQPIPPGRLVELNPQPIPPGRFGR